MDYLAELPISSDALGLIIAGLIFVVTVVLIAKKLISFLITVVLLFFAIASGMAIAHNDLVREYFSKDKVSHSSQNNDENFFEPLRAEAVQLLNRIVDLLHSEKAPRGQPEDKPASNPPERSAPPQQGGEGLQSAKFGSSAKTIAERNDR